MSRMSSALVVLFVLASWPVLALDGVRITTLTERGGRLDVAPNGQWIVFDRLDADLTIRLWQMDIAGKRERPLALKGPAAPRGQTGQPALHPSGHYIVFQAVNPALKGLEVLGKATATILKNPGAGLQNDLWLVGADGGVPVQLNSVPDRGGVLHPHVSPDGRTLVWAEHLPKAPGRPQNHWVLKAAPLEIGARGARLGEARVYRPDGMTFYEPHSFLPGGRRLIYCATDGDNFGLDLYLLDLETGASRALTRDREWDEHAHVSPDGRRIVWASSRGNPNARRGREALLDYWIMDADGGNPRRLTRFNDKGARAYIPAGAIASDFAWLPDGSGLVAFVQIMNRRAASPIVRIDLR